VNSSDQPTGVATGVRDGLAKPMWTPYEDLPDTAAGDVGDAAEATDAPTSKLISLGDIGAAIKRRKKVWLIAAVVGLLVGGVLFVVSKPVYQVSVSVLITNDPSVDPVTQQTTNQLLAEAPTLDAAMIKKLGLNETPVAFAKTYTVTVTSNQVITIAISAPSADLATNYAKTLAAEFLQFRASTLTEQQSTVFAAENQQLTTEQQALSALNKQISQISSGSATAGQGTSLSDLRTKQAKASATVSALQESVASSQAAMRITTTSMISGSSILSVSPPALEHARKKTLIEYVGGGLLGGLVVGLGIIAVGAVVTDRLRRRSDIAEALGTPVRISASLAETGSKLPAGLGRGAGGGRPGEPDGGMNRVVGYLRNALPGRARGAATLAIIAVDNSKDVAPIVVALAIACARDGKRVLLADLSGGALAEKLGETKPGIQSVTVNQDRIVLAIPPAGDVAAVGPLTRTGSLATAANGIAAAYGGADILITMAVLDPAVGADHLSTWTKEAVAVVTAGASTTVKLHTTGEMVRGVGIHLASAVLLGADSADESLGVVG
jgi:capsular polysaccharide biosynthesis protein